MIAIASNAAGSARIWVLGALLVIFAVGSVHADGQEPEDGLFVTVQNPITDATISQIKSRIDRAISQPGRRIKKVVFDFNPDNKEAATESYGSCLDLARFIRNKLNNNGIITVAFVHGKTTRHTVLPVLACTDLVMSVDAQIGEVSAPNEFIPEKDAKEYADFAGEAREAVIMKMIDRNVEVVMDFAEGARFTSIRRRPANQGRSRMFSFPKTAKSFCRAAVSAFTTLSKQTGSN